mmetsp:Transcript_54179/g.171942  ORF Transcript_54179/g.171942 Transcript_54179/m.171942 type:complete len:245 (-) Transcript_54179:32-766(-)
MLVHVGLRICDVLAPVGDALHEEVCVLALVPREVLHGPPTLLRVGGQLEVDPRGLEEIVDRFIVELAEADVGSVNMVSVRCEHHEELRHEAREDPRLGDVAILCSVQEGVGLARACLAICENAPVEACQNVLQDGAPDGFVHFLLCGVSIEDSVIVELLLRDRLRYPHAVSDASRGRPEEPAHARRIGLLVHFHTRRHRRIPFPPSQPITKVDGGPHAAERQNAALNLRGLAGRGHEAAGVRGV